VKRKALHLQTDIKKGISLYLDEINAKSILNYIEQSPKHRKKFEYIKGVILQNLRVPDVFDKEDINEKCKDVYAMKFFKGGDNGRLYCKRTTQKGKNCLVFVMAEVHPKKKSQKNSQKEISLIEKVASYEYEFEG
jgi:hypothetical protein